MKLSSVVMLALLSSVGVTSLALAQQEMQSGRDFAQGRRHEAMHRSLPAQNEQKFPKNITEQHSLSDAPGLQQAVEPRPEPGQSPGHERLTPEERHQLRQDINAAGRDIYRHNRKE